MTAPPSRLQKLPPVNPRLPRSTSGQYLDEHGYQKPLPIAPGNMPSPATAAERGIFLPPPPIGGADYFAHPSSPNLSSRPSTAGGSDSRPTTPTTPVIRVQGGQAPLTPPTSVKDEKKSKRKSWFGRSKSTDVEQGPAAWVVGHREKIAFDLAGLQGGRPVPDLWDPNGDCLVYIFPRSMNKGPSFRVESSIFASSPILMRMAFGDLHHPSASAEDGGSRQMSAESHFSALSLQTPPATPQLGSGRAASSQFSQSSRSTHSSYDDPPREVHLYLDIALTDTHTLATPGSNEPRISENLDTLVAVRNLFAFLMGQSLVATEKRSSLFSVFMKLSELLKFYEFANMDMSTYGEVATTSFDSYIEELGLADVRYSRQKTVEGIVLGERMRSVSLFNEAFTHCAGKHDEIAKLNSSIFRLISPITVNRLGRAAMDLDKRTASVRHTLEDFDFPSIFAGIMNSKTADERKVVDFDSWRDSFFSTRKFLLGYYKHRFGSWPPRASSKKNDLETSGLNRLVLRELYDDLAALYDMLVDRSNLTNRTADGVLSDERDLDQPDIRAMRHILSEYDRSSPPVKPPVPFDLPLMPSLKSTRPEFGTGDTKKDVKAVQKKIKDEELSQILHASHNLDTSPTPFVKAFIEFEWKAARSSNIQNVHNMRMGQWMFMYAVLQALPMLVIDAPGIRYSQSVEYFLCEPPRSGVPWAREDAMRHKKNWYGIAGGGGVVSLPSDVIEHSTDGVYRRSHCWQMAEIWSAGNPILASAVYEQAHAGQSHSPDMTPPLRGLGFRTDSRSSSPVARSKRESSMMLGLEALPLPAGATPDGVVGDQGRVASPPSLMNNRNDPTKTFDAILANTQTQVKGKKKR